MIVVQNPLKTYIDWLVSQNIDWADSIAENFFESWAIMDQTKILQHISKEEYDAKLKAMSSYLKSIEAGEEGLTPPDFYWDEGDYDYGEGDQYFEGARLNRLLTYLNKFQELNNARHIVKIAGKLFQDTDYMLFIYTTGKFPISLDEYHRDEYIKNLLKGDLAKADKEEHELHLLQEEQAALLATKASWDNFIKDDFNRETIRCYELARLFDM
jgi:hypothetical protein